MKNMEILGHHISDKWLKTLLPNLTVVVIIVVLALFVLIITKTIVVTIESLILLVLSSALTIWFTCLSFFETVKNSV